MPCARPSAHTSSWSSSIRKAGACNACVRRSGRKLPPAAAFGRDFKRDPDGAAAAAFAVARLLADDLKALGINTNCAPVVDLPVPGSHEIIGDRAYGTDPAQVIALAKAVAEGFMAGGVVPVIKHIPGHGRATADSHLALPVVTESRAELSATDFAPFKALSGMPAAMTAHVVFRSIDPKEPASTSAIVTREIIRGEIGFDGLLMSDDLSMKALAGDMRARARARDRCGLGRSASLQWRSDRDAGSGCRRAGALGPRRGTLCSGPRHSWPRPSRSIRRPRRCTSPVS